MEEKYYELTDEFKVNVFGIKLFRIKCTRKIKYANVGDLGGFVEKEDNVFIFAVNVQAKDNAGGKAAAETALAVLRDKNIY